MSPLSFPIHLTNAFVGQTPDLLADNTRMTKAVQQTKGPEDPNGPTVLDPKLRQKPVELLSKLVEQFNYVFVTESHPLNDERILIPLLPKLKNKGLTVLAIELPTDLQSAVDHYLKTKNTSRFPELPSWNFKALFPLMEAAHKLGLKVVCIDKPLVADPQNPALKFADMSLGVRDQYMSEQIAQIPGKVLVVLSSDHVPIDQYPYKTARTLLHEKNIATAGVVLESANHSEFWDLRSRVKAQEKCIRDGLKHQKPFTQSLAACLTPDYKRWDVVDGNWSASAFAKYANDPNKPISESFAYSTSSLGGLVFYDYTPDCDLNKTGLRYSQAFNGIIFLTEQDTKDADWVDRHEIHNVMLAEALGMDPILLKDAQLQVAQEGQSLENPLK